MPAMMPAIYAAQFSWPRSFGTLMYVLVTGVESWIMSAGETTQTQDANVSA